MPRNAPRTSTRACRALLLSAFLASLLPGASAVLFDVEDGWTQTDDVYADADDYLTVSFGSDLDSRYVFDATASVDTYCLEIDAGLTNRAHTFLMNGDLAPALGVFQYASFDFLGDEWTIQTIGGTGSTCRFHVWKNKACDEWYPDQTGASYPPGCEPDIVNWNLAEGDTEIDTVGGDDVEVTCLAAGVHNYVKCQAPTFADLDSCIDSSLAEDNGGDNFMLYDACLASSDSGSDTEDICDVATVGEDWELSVFSDTLLSPEREEIFLRGMPNVSFNLYAYNGCGTGSFDRDFVEAVYLTQFNYKERVCDGYGYYPTGVSEGYYPWFGGSGYTNESYPYGQNSCAVGQTCVSREREQVEFDQDLNACFADGGSCYDAVRNQDETAADYGGVCGACANDTRAVDDVYWLVARESYPVGHFSAAQPFNATTYCPQGEDATNGVVAFVTVVVTVVLGGLVVLLLAASVSIFLIAFYGVGVFKRIFSKKKAYKAEELKK